MSETVVSEAAVHELLGLKIMPRQFGVNLFIINWNGRRFIDREDVLAWLKTNAESTSSPLLHRLYDELAEITAKGES